MTNNDILRSLRFAFDFSDKKAVELFSKDPNSVAKINKAEFQARIAKEEDANYIECSDGELGAFLDGLIAHNRGLQEGKAPTPPISRLTKNDVLKKLRIALNYREEDMLATLKSGGTTLSKSELSALFRKPQHKHYRSCGNQVLRNFIKGLCVKLRPLTKDQ